MDELSNYLLVIVIAKETVSFTSPFRIWTEIRCPAANTITFTAHFNLMGSIVSFDWRHLAIAIGGSISKSICLTFRISYLPYKKETGNYRTQTHVEKWSGWIWESNVIASSHLCLNLTSDCPCMAEFCSWLYSVVLKIWFFADLLCVQTTDPPAGPLVLLE
jgi:hypothetical protein